LSVQLDSTGAEGRQPVQVWLDAAQRRVEHMLDLIAAETRLAAVSGLMMVVLAILAAAAAIVAWLLVVVTVIYFVAAAGASWPWVALAFAAVHGAIAFCCWKVARRLSRNLTLPETRSTMATAGVRGSEARSNGG
jgi:hypothetical protein